MSLLVSFYCGGLGKRNRYTISYMFVKRIMDHTNGVHNEQQKK